MSAVNAVPPHPEVESDSRTTEPSMEDILASIRRIIADDQSRQAPVFKRNAPSLPTRVVAAPPEPILSTDSPVSEPPATVQLLPDLDDRDDEVAAVPHLTPPPVSDPEPAHGTDEAAIDAIAHAGAAAILRPTFPPGSISGGSAPRQAETSRAFTVPTGPAASAMPSAKPEPLVSPSTAAGIESSFQALATTVFLQNTEMVEGMMRDMLRPLLKTWLDDNLPSIVERLVRTEIERVARGGRG